MRCEMENVCDSDVTPNKVRKSLQSRCHRVPHTAARFLLVTLGRGGPPVGMTRKLLCVSYWTLLCARSPRTWCASHMLS